MTTETKRPRGRPPGARNKHGVPKVNVHYRIDPRIDAALRNPGTVSATLEEWAKRAGVIELNAEHPVAVQIDPDTARRLDEIGGGRPRAAVIRELVEYPQIVADVREQMEAGNYPEALDMIRSA